MGVIDFYRKFIREHIEEERVNVYADKIASVLLDANGILYEIAEKVYKLNGSESEKEILIEKYRKEQGKIELFIEFKFQLKQYLTDLIIRDMRPTEILIIAFDGQASRAKQKQQRGRRFDLTYDDYFVPSLEFTVGTETMVNCCKVVKEWIQENEDDLPPLVYFSSCSEHGEAEHKIFNIFEHFSEILIENKGDFTEDYRKLFLESNHAVIGKDSDLFFLSSIRQKYKFIWFNKSIIGIKQSDRNKFLDINKTTDEIFEKMSNREKIKSQCINDFILISFLIGDDFVPANFSLNLNVGNSLVKMLKVYKECNNGRILNLTDEIDGDLRINLESFNFFLSRLKETEIELFLQKVEFQRLEKIKRKSLEDEILLAEMKKKLDINEKNKLEKSDFLDMNFSDYLEEWKQNVVFPNYRNLPESKKNFVNELSSWEIEKYNAAKEYILGLQWNLSCYFGRKDISDWVYKWTFAPTIHHLSDVLSEEMQKKNKSIYLSEHLNEANSLPISSIVMTLFNVSTQYNFIIKVLLGKKTIPKTNYEFPDLFYPFSPSVYKQFSEGIYHDPKNKFKKTAILPFIPREIQNSVRKERVLETRVKACGDVTEYGKIGETIIFSEKESKLFKELRQPAENKKGKKKKSVTLSKNLESRRDRSESEGRDRSENEGRDSRGRDRSESRGRRDRSESRDRRDRSESRGRRDRSESRGRSESRDRGRDESRGRDGRDRSESRRGGRSGRFSGSRDRDQNTGRGGRFNESRGGRFSGSRGGKKISNSSWVGKKNQEEI